MIADYQCHWYPGDYLETLLGRTARPRTERTENGYLYEGATDTSRALVPRFWRLEDHLASIKEHGIDVMVCSPNLIGEVTDLPTAEAVAITTELNERFAQAQRDHPESFVGLAMLPMQDADAACEVLEHAIGKLKLGGVCVLSHVNHGPLADESTLPIYRAIEELGVTVFLHPAERSSAFRPGDVRAIESGLGWVYDTSRGALQLILSGTLDTCPSLQVVHPHAGGVLPYVIGRVAQSAERNPTVAAADTPGLERRFLEYFRENFWADSVAHTDGALRLALDMYGVDRMLFGTDFPWQQRAPRIQYLRENATEEEVEQIFHRNVPTGITLPSSREAA